MEKPTPSETIGMVVITVIMLAMLAQGDRIWGMLERLVVVEQKVEKYHEP